MRSLSLFPRRNLPQDIWRQFDDIFHSWIEPTLDIDRSGFVPALDIEDRGDAYALSFDLPGLKEDDIKVEVRDNTLFVSGERQKEEKKENGEYCRYERSFGRFERAISLPPNIDSEKIDASYKDGVLELFIPKSENTRLKTIEVKKT